MSATATPDRLPDRPPLTEDDLTALVNVLADAPSFDPETGAPDLENATWTSLLADLDEIPDSFRRLS